MGHDDRVDSCRIIRRRVILVSLLIAAALPAAAADAAAWRVGVAHDTGALMSQRGGQAFVQFHNLLGIEAWLGPPAWQPGITAATGVQAAWEFALPSDQSAVLSTPGWDGLRLGMVNAFSLGPDLRLRIVPHGVLARYQTSDFWQFWLGTSIGAGWRFSFDHGRVEPGVNLTVQFRNDLGTVWGFDLGVRVGLGGD